METEAQQSSLRTTSFLVFPDPIDPNQSTDPQAIQECVLRLRDEAFLEEQSGCFGKAEVLWKKAIGLAERYLPGSQMLARVAIEAGCFFFRFLPKSHFPLKYLRTGLSLSYVLDAGEVTRATLTLAKSLIGCQYFKEAEDLLCQIDRSVPETDVQVVCCLGIDEYAKQDILKAESILREAAEKAQNINPELHAECVAHLCEVLLEKEQYSECQTLLLQHIQFLALHHSPCLSFALRILMKELKETNQFHLLDTTLKSVIADLRAANARPYLIAEIQLEWGNIYLRICPECAFIHYIQSLRIYKAARQASWYIVQALSRLMRLYKLCGTTSDWIAPVSNRSFGMISDIIGDLPIAATALSVDISTFRSSYFQYQKNSCVKAKLELLLNSCDEVECGEALLCLNSQEAAPEAESLVVSYVSTHPGTLLSARLLSLVCKEVAQMVKIYLKAGASQSEIASYLETASIHTFQFVPPRLTEKYCATAPPSLKKFNALVDLHRYYQFKNCSEEAANALQRALRTAEAINPQSSRYFSALFAQKVTEEAYTQFYQTVINQNPLSGLMLDRVISERPPHQEVGQASLWQAVIKKIEGVLFHTPLHLANIQKCVSYLNNSLPHPHISPERILSYSVDNEFHIKGLYQQVKEELDWFSRGYRSLVVENQHQLMLLNLILQGCETNHKYGLCECLFVNIVRRRLSRPDTNYLRTVYTRNII